MTTNDKPDKNTERTEPEKDEKIIELEDEIGGKPEDDDEILDLLDAVEEIPVEDQKDIPLAETETTIDDEDFLELTDEVVEPSQDDEEIIDLMDAVEEIAVEPDEDDTIIELVAEPGDTTEGIEPPVFTTDATSPKSDDLPDLEKDLFEETIDFDEELDQEVALDPPLKEDFADSLGVELEGEKDIPEDSLTSDRVSDQQIEAALERVIKKMFYEKIDGILVEVIEKTVKKEIERLKNILLEEESGS